MPEISEVVRSLNTTTLYVTHDQTEAMTMGDRMAVMKAGHLQQLGSPSSCYDTPMNIFVAQFVGSPPMNLITARVVEAPEGLQLKFGDVEPRDPGLAAVEPPRAEVVHRQVGGAGGAQRGHGGREPRGRPPREPDHGQGHAHRGSGVGDRRAPHVSRRAVDTADTELLAKETGEGELHLGDEGVKWVASFTPRSRVRMGDDIEIAVDLDRVHFFDHDTSDAIWD